MAFDALGSKMQIPADLLALAEKVHNSPVPVKSPGGGAIGRSSARWTNRTTAYGQDIRELKEWMASERTSSGVIRRKVRKAR